MKIGDIVKFPTGKDSPRSLRQMRGKVFAVHPTNPSLVKVSWYEPNGHEDRRGRLSDLPLTDDKEWRDVKTIEIAAGAVWSS